MAYTAFGVEPDRRATYELRQSRYQALGEEVAREAQRICTEQGSLSCRLLDVGTYDGVARRYIEAHAGCELIRYEAVDIYPRGVEFVYRHQDWKLHHIDLLGGLPSLPDDAYDIVLCEQVLEHLTVFQPLLEDTVRVLKPGGLMILGVPIFPLGLHLARRHVTPIIDRIFSPGRVRGHVQAWSLRTFRRELRIVPNLEILECRGFRIVSGGVLRPLEFTRAWWKLNRRFGRLVPGLCIEVQLVCRKRADLLVAAKAWQGVQSPLTML